MSNAEASLHFHRDVLGLQVVGRSENYGTEQEHLNNVFGAHLSITSLRAGAGPGVEFLEYLTPRTSRIWRRAGDGAPGDSGCQSIHHFKRRPCTLTPRFHFQYQRARLSESRPADWDKQIHPEDRSSNTLTSIRAAVHPHLCAPYPQCAQVLYADISTC